MDGSVVQNYRIHLLAFSETVIKNNGKCLVFSRCMKQNQYKSKMGNTESVPVSANIKDAIMRGDRGAMLYWIKTLPQDFSINHSYYIAMAMSESHSSLVLDLIKYGADVNTTFNDGEYTLLMVASARGALIIVETLIKYGARINYTAPDGESALSLAMKRTLNRQNMMEILLRYGADPNTPRCRERAAPVSIAAPVPAKMHDNALMAAAEPSPMPAPIDLVDVNADDEIGLLSDAPSSQPSNDGGSSTGPFIVAMMMSAGR